jgi:hypothetical protein
MMLLPIVSKVCSTIAQELGSYCATLRWHAHIRGLTSAKVLASAAPQGSAYSAPTHLPESEPIAVLAQPSGVGQRHDRSRSVPLPPAFWLSAGSPRS